MKFVGYNWWIAVILDFKIRDCGTIRHYDGFELGCSVLPRRQIETSGTGILQGSPNHYSCVRANSHKSCMDQEDRLVIKFRSGQKLFDLIKL